MAEPGDDDDDDDDDDDEPGGDRHPHRPRPQTLDGATVPLQNLPEAGSKVSVV